MKFFFSIMLSCTLLSSPFYEEQPLIQPASADLSESSYQMSVAKGEVAELSARQLEIRLGLEEGELLGITITALPDNGSLVLDGARISEFSQLTREELDRLCFVPGENALRSGFLFIPNCPSRATATLSVMLRMNCLRRRRRKICFCIPGPILESKLPLCLTQKHKPPLSTSPAAHKRAWSKPMDNLSPISLSPVLREKTSSLMF